MRRCLSTVSEEEKTRLADPGEYMEAYGQTIDSIDGIGETQAIATIPHVDGASINDHRRHTTAHIHH